MTHYDFDLGIIGGGAAGLTVASGAAQLGAKTLLVEREPQLGGDCLHFGCVPSKTLIKSAHVYHLMKNGPRFGLPQVDPPPVDFSLVAERIANVIAVIQKHDSSERFCKLGAKVEFGQAHFTDERAISLNGKTITAKQWVIASGSSPTTPPITGLADTPHITNKEIFSLDKLPESMIFLGGGPIGIEMAQAFNRLGSRVTVVDRGDQILGKEDHDMAKDVMAVMADEGVTFHLETAIESVADKGAHREVIITDRDGNRQTLTAEEIVVATGRKPNLEGLGLDEIGIKQHPGGIKVDGRLRTSHKHIYAAGDVNGNFQFTHAAGYEGGIVISNAIFHLPRKVNYTYLPWCTYTDPELASIGMNEKSAQAANIDYKVLTEYFVENDRGLAEGVQTGRIKMILNEREKPLGVQILGPHAGELIGEWVAILNGGVKLSTLAGAIHPYPTLGEINKRVAGSLLASKIFSDKVRKGLKLFFNLKGRACHYDEDTWQK